MSCLWFVCLFLLLPLPFTWCRGARGMANLPGSRYYPNKDDHINTNLAGLASLICRALHQQTPSNNHSGHFSNEKCRLECLLPSGNKYRHNLFDGSPCPHLIDKNHVSYCQTTTTTTFHLTYPSLMFLFIFDSRADLSRRLLRGVFIRAGTSPREDSAPKVSSTKTIIRTNKTTTTNQNNIEHSVRFA